MGWEPWWTVQGDVVGSGHTAWGPTAAGPWAHLPPSNGCEAKVYNTVHLQSGNDEESVFSFFWPLWVTARMT